MLNRERLSETIAAADLRVLLMVLVQMTGDRKWMSEPYRPRRDVELIADRNAGFDDERQAEIRSAAVEILSAANRPAIEVPDSDLMVEMMSACLGETVPPEYADMMREEVGFVSRFAHWENAGSAAEKLAARPRLVGIVGAGSSGIALGTNLLKLGIPFVIFEANDEVGGTWYRHRYPGCGVDTPNHAYSFSFGSRFAWSRYFAPRNEIQQYMQGIADESGIRPHIRFGTKVVGAVWDEQRQLWQIEVQTGEGRETVEVDIFVSAIGQLSQPYRMPIDGEESFSGRLLHPMDWPDDLTVDGKDVGIVGNGASAMQIVTAIADKVRSLTIYQRTPQWARPISRYHDPIGDDQQWLLKEVPFYAAWFRFTMLWRYGDGLLPTLRKDPDWPHPTRSVNRVNERHRQDMERHIRQELEGRDDLLEKCIPDYPPFGKRILLDAGWYKAIRRPNVELVTDSIARLADDKVVARDGTARHTDVLIVSTGYVVNELTARLNVVGRDGRTLSDVWGDDDPKAYLGCTVSGFPNLFIIYGPNTGLAHGGSAIFMNECAARYVASNIVQMIEKDIGAVEIKPDVVEDYARRIDREHAALVWTAPGLESYYRNSKGRVTSANPWRLVDYWAMTHNADLENYVTTPPNAGKAGG